MTACGVRSGAFREPAAWSDPEGEAMTSHDTALAGLTSPPHDPTTARRQMADAMRRDMENSDERRPDECLPRAIDMG